MVAVESSRRDVAPRRLEDGQIAARNPIPVSNQALVVPCPEGGPLAGLRRA